MRGINVNSAAALTWSMLSAASGRDIKWSDWLAPALILVTPFVHFLLYHEYGLLKAESLLAIATLAGIGLLASLVMTVRPKLKLPLLARPLQLRPLVFAAAIVCFLDLQPELKWATVGLMSRVFHDGRQCETCVVIFFIAAFVLVYVFSAVLKENAGTVLTAVFWVALLAVILMPRSENARRVNTQTHTSIGTAIRSDLPPIVHIVLDEQIGIAGLPEDVPGAEALRTELTDFYLNNGFRLYGRAFSQYHNTPDSITNTLNSTELDGRLQLVTPSGLGYSITRNAWFDQLTAQGYRIHVFQTDHLDYCGDESHRITECTTAPATGIAAIENQKIAVSDKAAILIRKLLKPSSVRGLVTSFSSYLHSLRSDSGKPPNAVPDIQRNVSLGAFWATMSADRMIDELGRIEPGTAYFAHLLLPHRGFILDEQCRMKADLRSWYDIPGLGLNAGRRLDGASRQARYIEYFKQVRCARQVIEKVLAALSRSEALDKAIIIVHGDHGSRIAERLPLQSQASSLTPTDLTDSFSTLFAIRMPGMPAGYDSSTRSLQGLFAELVSGRAEVQERPVVFLTPFNDAPNVPFGEYRFPGFD